MARRPIPPALKAKQERDRKNAFIKAAGSAGVNVSLQLNKKLARIHGVEVDDDADTTP